MVKKIVFFILVISILLCACGKGELVEKTEDGLLVPADEYEVEWVDTSNLAYMDEVAARVVDSRICFMQSILVSEDEDGKVKHKYEEIFYDMISGEWSESKTIPAEEQINQIGFGSVFLMASDGMWYFQCMEWDEKQKQYRNGGIARLLENGEVEKIELPEDIAEEKLVVAQYTIRNDGKLCIKVYPESKAGDDILPQEMNVVTYDPATETFEYGGDLLMGMFDFLSIGDEYFYQSVAQGGCGYAVKTPKTGDVVQREIFCEGEIPEGGWTQDPIRDVYDTCDEEDNLYVFNSGGIYGGYYKDSSLKNIVPPSIIAKLNLSTAHEKEKSNYISNFWRGAETDYADFYVMNVDTSEYSKMKITLAHIKKKEK